MSGRQPSHDVLVYDSEDHYTRVGVAWPLKNKPGFSIQLQAGLSVANTDGARIILLERKEGGRRGRSE